MILIAAGSFEPLRKKYQGGERKLHYKSLRKRIITKSSKKQESRDGYINPSKLFMHSTQKKKKLILLF